MEKLVLRLRAASRPGHVKSDPKHGMPSDAPRAAVALPEREELMSSRDDRDELARPKPPMRSTIRNRTRYKRGLLQMVALLLAILLYYEHL